MPKMTDDIMFCQRCGSAAMYIDDTVIDDNIHINVCATCGFMCALGVMEVSIDDIELEIVFKQAT
jgi:transcription elongation factor Elf1